MDVILHDTCFENESTLLAGDAPEEPVQESGNT